jgi:anaerobic magnesium-protoporphyrin IX monomethyl ester cyclase
MIPRLLLLKPPEASAFDFGAFSLAVLAGAVRDRAEVTIVDATGREQDSVVREIVARGPDLLGVTVMGPSSVPPVAALLALVRKVFRGPKRPVVLAGGHGASMLPSPMLRAGADAVVIGEGERTLAEILEHGVRPGAAGIACMADGEMVVGPQRPPISPLDELPPPARDLLGPARAGDVHLIETSRGCPHACSFCEATRFHGRRWRAFSPERVARDLARLVNGGAWIIEIADDSFAASPQRVLRICELVRQGPLPAIVFVSARADDLAANPKVIPAMASARMLRVSVGVETLEPTIAAAAGKPISPSTYRRVFDALRANGIFSVASLIVGLPGETPEARRRAVERAVDAQPDAARFVPFLPRAAVRADAALEEFEPRPEDVRDAAAFTEAFHRDPTVQARLVDAARAADVRATLARGTLQRHRSQRRRDEVRTARSS